MRRQLEVVAAHAVEHLAQLAVASLRRGDPLARRERRIVAHVLDVPATQPRHPVPMHVGLEPDHRTLHQRGPATPDATSPSYPPHLRTSAPPHLRTPHLRTYALLSTATRDNGLVGRSGPPAPGLDDARHAHQRAPVGGGGEQCGDDGVDLVLRRESGGEHRVGDALHGDRRNPLHLADDARRLHDLHADADAAGIEQQPGQPRPDVGIVSLTEVQARISFPASKKFARSPGSYSASS